MRDFTGIAPSSLPPPTAPGFQPRLRNMLALIDYWARDASRGFARITAGEVPDGSGNGLPVDPGSPTLLDYLFLPGRSGGQTAAGGTNADDVLVLKGSAHTSGGEVTIRGGGSSYLSVQRADSSEAVRFAAVFGASAGPTQLDVFGDAAASNKASTFSVRNSAQTRSTQLISGSFLVEPAVVMVGESGLLPVVFGNPQLLLVAGGSYSQTLATVRIGPAGTTHINPSGVCPSFSVPLTVYGSTGQTAALTDWRTVATALLSSIDSLGTFVGPVNATGGRGYPSFGFSPYGQSDASGLVPGAALGSGTSDSSVFLRGDRTWVAAPGAAGGDSVTVNGVAVVDADFDDATPVAPASGINVKWQKDASSPANISAYLDFADLAANLMTYDDDLLTYDDDLVYA